MHAIRCSQQRCSGGAPQHMHPSAADHKLINRASGPGSSLRSTLSILWLQPVSPGRLPEPLINSFKTDSCSAVPCRHCRVAAAAAAAATCRQPFCRQPCQAAGRWLKAGLPGLSCRPRPTALAPPGRRMSLEFPASRPLRSAYEREVQQQGAAQLLASPSLLAAWAAQRGISVARAELQLLQARLGMLGSRWLPLRRCVRHAAAGSLQSSGDL